MAKFAIMASELKSLKKSIEDKKLAELKKEIIEILKKQDEKDFKKAIDYFESQELHFTHLEKSLVSGKWIEKAGYGIGTVRIWKGKKYKKIAPGKWARVFEKEGRGTNIAIGKLIAKVQKIDNVEDLMAFVMQNKQRFVDENGVDLPVLDKLRSAVDARNGNVGSKEKTVEDKIKENPDYPFKPKTEKERAERAAFEKDRDDFIERMDKIRQEKKDSKPTEKKEELSWKEKVLIATDEGAKKELGRGKMYKKHITDIQKIANSNINDIPEKLKTLNDFIEYQDSLSNPDYKQAGKDYARLKNHELAREIWKKVDDGEAEWDDNGYLKLDKNGLLAKPDKKEESKTYWIQDPYGDRLTNEDAKNWIKENYSKIEEIKNSDVPRKDMQIRKLKYEILDLKDRLNPEDRKEIESEVEKHQNRSEKVGVISFNELQPIATNKSVGENEVQMPYSKDLADEIESLKNCTAPKYSPIEAFKHIFYKDGKLVTTDTRRMKFVEVGELEGIPDGSYVDINTDKSGINVKKIDFNAQFPNYSKVIPDNLNQTATLDTKLVKDKIKEMYKDGAISKKGSNLIQLEFRDGKVFIDDTAVGEAKDIKMKYSDDWGPARNDTNYMSINADYFVNALSGKTSVMQIGERADKAIAINTGSTSNILMPMSGTDKKTDYSKGRSEKEKAKADKAAEIEKNKEFNKELCKVFESKYGYDLVKNMVEHIDERLPNFSDENLQREYTRLGLNFDKLMEKNATTINTILDKKTSTDLKTAYLYSRVMKEHPEVKEKIAAELEKRGITVKKSLFDDFIVDVFEADDEEEIEDELYEGETEYNDYSAVQPELFNSTEMKVREALDRIKNQVL